MLQYIHLLHELHFMMNEVDFLIKNLVDRFFAYSTMESTYLIYSTLTHGVTQFR